MGLVRTALVTVAAEAALLGLLSATIGITGAGWAVGMLTAIATNALLVRALRATNVTAPGAANLITLTRAMLVAAVAALVTDGVTNLPVTLALTALALTLDAVDGQVARRTNTISPVGARFDGELDAFLILVLSVAVARTAGPWVLAIGAWRYVFGAAGWILPWLRQPLPHSMWRKTVAAIQGVVLFVALSGLLPHAVMVASLVGALILLSESFCHDVWWLWTRRSPSPKVRTRRRQLVGSVVTGLALIVAWGALVAPDRPYDLAATSFLRIPIDGLAVIAVLLLLPGRPRRFLAVLAGVVLAGLTLTRTLDIGFFSVLDRPFSLVTDWGSLQPGIKVLIDSIGRSRAILATTVAIVLAAVILGTIALATARVAHAAVRHRRATARAVVALGTVWTVTAVFGVATPSGMPVASRSAAQALSDEVRMVRADLRDEHTFKTQLAGVDTFGHVPRAALLDGLHGKDVLLVFVESYGRVAVDGSSFSPRIDRLLTAGTTELTAAGISTRSAFLTSPTFGSRSWFAHSTLQSGLWIDNPDRYAQLVASRRFTLSQAFERAGWRTVFDMPSTEGAWPEGRRFYGFDAMYGATDVGYAGPAFSFAKVPDQYTLQALNQRELESVRRPPLFAEVVLDSSHAPWTPLPHMVPWRALGDGTVFGPMTHHAMSAATVWSSAANAKAAYAQSIRYSLTALISFLKSSQDKNLVVIALGDHQPATLVTGYNASHDVPVTVFARDPRVIDRIDGWGWQPGMLPGPHAPVSRMDTFRDRFLTTFGSPAEETLRAQASMP